MQLYVLGLYVLGFYVLGLYVLIHKARHAKYTLE